MSKKFLSRVIAGAALGGVALFAAPAAAQAEVVPPQTDGRHHEHGTHQRGHLGTWPPTVSPGQRAKLFLVCHTPQRHPWAWSSVTGKLRLKPLPTGGDRDYENWKKHWHPDWKPDWNPTPRPPAPPTDGPTQPPAPPTDGPTRPPAPPTDGPTQPPAPPTDWPTQPPAPPTDQPTAQPEPTIQPNDQLPDTEQPPAPAGAGAGVMTPDQPTANPADFGHDAAQRAHGGYVYWTSFEVPRHTKPGRYELKGSCGRGELIVAPLGWVDGGDGGSTRTGMASETGLATGGATLLGAAALGGLLLVRRRRTGDYLS
ncbi:hypothetical protein V6U90_12770 [Micromonospora sp. CPCC 206060]|uniref:hypothetical protein n=1 Tax=Micromonospora sp. CPCC 206060 TaxID=3122406 RepID=UPI002FF41C22